MIQVGLLTVEQKDEIQDKEYAPDSFFNAIQDASDNWIISQEEMNQCVNPLYIWVKDLTLIIYEPKPPINPFPPM